ncbi:SDR family NAD(P)-dependent oxidoreductase [Halobaculum sp. MBLA0143]|uniref:SDR family NAD(P)-dependent oxidoreductase n=1 Tax=Halobaculum sp. MBLA0143 TaxID=3079933 RepID=UPI003524CC5C
MTDDGERPVALVTGAAGGIGRATVARFAAAGWRVYATDADEAALSAADWDGHSVSTARLDVTDADDRERVVDRVAAETGRLDCLVSLAGYALPGPVLDVPSEAVRELYDVLVHGPTALVRTAFDDLVASEGRIVTVTSSLLRAVFPGTGHYAAAKAAAARTTEAVRIECLDTPVSVTTVEPAWVDTPFERRAADRLPEDRRAAFDRTYRFHEAGRMLDGGPAAVSPARVARTVYRAATADRPRSVYPVGLPAVALWLAGLVPVGLADQIRTGVAETVTRFRSGRRRLRSFVDRLRRRVG